MKIHQHDDIHYLFNCPGCHCTHMIKVPGWSFNMDFDKPTVSPSIRVRAHNNYRHRDTICHSFVKDGMIQFLGDCTHKLAGQTVELPEWETA